MYNRAFRTFADGSSIGFGRGKIDKFCVFVKDKTGVRAPLDIEYFQFIHDLAAEYGTLAVYNAFKRIYDVADKELLPEAGSAIDQASERFSESNLKPRFYFSILYLCMVAEQNYPNTRLGKRLKRLGIYQILFEGMAVPEAANWSRGKSWRVIAAECEKRGF